MKTPRILVPIGIKISESQRKILEEISREKDLSISWIVRKAIDNWIDKEKGGR